MALHHTHGRDIGIPLRGIFVQADASANIVKV